MIEEVLSLGVKGADLVLSQLEKIQEEKEKFARPSNVSINAAQNSAFPPAPGQKSEQKDTKGQSVLKSILDAVKAQKDALVKGIEGKGKTKQASDQPKPQNQPTTPEEKKKEEKNETLEKLGQSAKGAAQGLATLSSGNAIRGVAQLLRAIPYVGDSLAEGTTMAVTALESFRANVENASKISLDTAESKSRIGNLVQGSRGENFTGRVDLDLNAQRALAESLGDRFGIVQKPLQDAIKELYKDQNGKKVDVNQASQLAQGNFAALGTDKGFFLQKIADQLQSLPPTMRQAMEASLLKNVTKAEQMTETSADERGTVTRFDKAQRDRAKDIMGESSVGSDGVKRSAADNALQIATAMNQLDGSLNRNFNSLLNGIRDALNRVAPSGTSNSIGRP